ncbi:alpha/beta fold hydrolase [Ralstonia sp. 1B3]|uniref:alpha/beta fold hydrolase n=1 Tax=Ralstonia sp. 1B3 TaxID=2997421 RepID=UPI002FCA22EC
MLRPGRIGLRSIGRDVLIARYAKPQSRYLPLMGTRVHYTDEGAANAEGTLLLIHGFGASLHTWDGVLPQLTRRYRVIRLDLPPFGITGPLRDAQGRPRTMELPLYRDFIDAFVDTLGLSKLTLIGNSLGGMVSWDCRAAPGPRREARADRLRRLPDEAADLHRSVQSHWRADDVAVDAARGDHPRRHARCVWRPVARVRTHAAPLRRFLLCRRCTTGHRQDGTEVPLDDVDTSGLASIRVPTLILWGQRDRWIPPAHAGEFARRIPGATLRMYPALGHIPMEEDPVRVGTDLCAFLDQGAQRRAFQKPHSRRTAHDASPSRRASSPAG